MNFVCRETKWFGTFPNLCVFLKKKLCVCLSTCLFVLSTLFSSIIIITLLVSIAILVSCHAGWGLSHMEVWRGFLVTIGWFLLFLIVAGFALRLRKWVKMVYRTINFERMTIYLSCVYSRTISLNYARDFQQFLLPDHPALICSILYHCIMLLNLTTVTMVHAWTLENAWLHEFSSTNL